MDVVEFLQILAKEAWKQEWNWAETRRRQLFAWFLLMDVVERACGPGRTTSRERKREVVEDVEGKDVPVEVQVKRVEEGSLCRRGSQTSWSSPFWPRSRHQYPLVLHEVLCSPIWPCCWHHQRCYKGGDNPLKEPWIGIYGRYNAMPKMVAVCTYPTSLPQKPIVCQTEKHIKPIMLLHCNHMRVSIEWRIRTIVSLKKKITEL